MVTTNQSTIHCKKGTFYPLLTPKGDVAGVALSAPLNRGTARLAPLRGRDVGGRGLGLGRIFGTVAVQSATVETTLRVLTRM